MTHFAFRVSKGTLTHPVVSGTVTASTMEEAVKAVIKLCGITVVYEIRNGYFYADFRFKDEKVSIIIYANAEDYITEEA